MGGSEFRRVLRSPGETERQLQQGAGALTSETIGAAALPGNPRKAGRGAQGTSDSPGGTESTVWRSYRFTSGEYLVAHYKL